MNLYYRRTEQKIYRNIEEISGSKTCSSQDAKSKKKAVTSTWRKKKILGKWAEYIRELFEGLREDYNVLKRNFAGLPIMKDEIRVAIRKEKSGKATALANASLELLDLKTMELIRSQQNSTKS